MLGGARGWHHDSIPSGMAAVFQWGRTSHLWNAELRSEFSLVNSRGGQAMTAGLAWIKPYDKGRVFASTIGHTRESFDDPEVARMYAEAIKWVLRLTGPDPAPRRP